MPKYHHTSSAEKRFSTLTEKFELDWEYHHELALLNIMEQFARAMESSDVTKAKLADELGVSRAYITQLLGGKPNLTLRTLFKVSWALGMKPVIRFEGMNGGKSPYGRKRAMPMASQGSPA